MIPDLIIRSKQSANGHRVASDVYSGDTKLLDIYWLDITSTITGTVVVAGSCQPFVYEGPAMLMVDPAYQKGVESTSQRVAFPDARTEDVRIEDGGKRRGAIVFNLETGEQINGVTKVAISVAHDLHDVVVTYIPLACEGDA